MDDDDDDDDDDALAKIFCDINADERSVCGS